MPRRLALAAAAVVSLAIFIRGGGRLSLDARIGREF